MSSDLCNIIFIYNIMLVIFTNHRGLAVNLCCNKSKKICDVTGFWSFKTKECFNSESCKIIVMSLPQKEISSCELTSAACFNLQIVKISLIFLIMLENNSWILLRW